MNFLFPIAEARLSFNSSLILGEEGQTVDVCLQLQGVNGEEEVATPFNVTIRSDGGKTHCFGIVELSFTSYFLDATDS